MSFTRLGVGLRASRHVLQSPTLRLEETPELDALYRERARLYGLWAKRKRHPVAKTSGRGHRPFSMTVEEIGNALEATKAAILAFRSTKGK
eukprot:9158093-Alexandrium_andersonii.AAC.1